MAFAEKIRASRVFQQLMRILQFLFAITSLGLFSSRVYKVIRLTKSLSAASGAVEGILAAAVAYTILACLTQCCLRANVPHIVRWLLVVFDVLFVGAFIAVAYLTNPNSGPSRPCYTSAQRNDPVNKDNTLCKLPLGTFVCAIFSTILHLITAIFHEVRDHRRDRKAGRVEKDGGYVSAY